MNALVARVVSSTVPRSVVLGRNAAVTTLNRRTMATFPPKKESFAKLWFSDPATYPIIVIIAGAVTAAFSFIGYKFTYCPNVRVTSNCKGKVIRTWS